MTLQTSGAISLGNLQTEFGGSNPISVNEYYRGGAYVPNTISSTASAYNLSLSESGGNAGWGGVFWRVYENSAAYGPLPAINPDGTNLYHSGFWTDQGWTSGNSTSTATFNVDRTATYVANVGGYNTGATRTMTVYRNGANVGATNWGSVTFSANAGDSIQIVSVMNTIGNYNHCVTTLTTSSGSRTTTTTVNQSIPSSGTVSMNQFYGGRKS